jgi:hypothetical protein
MKGIRAIVFVFVPIYVEVARTRVPKSAVIVSSQNGRSNRRKMSNMEQNAREDLRGLHQENQRRLDDPPFWTWFVDNQQLRRSDAAD